MKLEELEREFKLLNDKVKNLEDRNKALQNRVQALDDIEEIKILQRCYGYFYEHGMGQEIVDLFADDPDTEIHWLGQGSFKGKETIAKLYRIFSDFLTPEKIHTIIQISGVVHVAPDGKTAKGRWYGLGIYDFGMGPGSLAISLYECEYIKQDGKWKIKMLEHGFLVKTTVEMDLKPPQTEEAEHMDVYPFTNRNIQFNPTHPTGYIRPFHFRHPVTGKPTSEGMQNSSLIDLKNVETWVTKL